MLAPQIHIQDAGIGKPRAEQGQGCGDSCHRPPYLIAAVFEQVADIHRDQDLVLHDQDGELSGYWGERGQAVS